MSGTAFPSAEARPLSPLAEALLRELAGHGSPSGAGGVSLPRLGKRLGQGVSVLMRELSLMGDAVLGGVPGPGWVRVLQTDGRWVAQLTPAGAARAAALPIAATSADAAGLGG